MFYTMAAEKEININPANTFYGLLNRWIRETKLKDLGNIPFGMQG